MGRAPSVPEAFAKHGPCMEQRSRRSHAARILHRRVPSTQSSTKYASPLTSRETTRTEGPVAPAAVVVRACTPSTFSVVFQPAGRQSFTPVTALS